MRHRFRPGGRRPCNRLIFRICGLKAKTAPAAPVPVSTIARISAAAAGKALFRLYYHG